MANPNSPTNGQSRVLDLIATAAGTAKLKLAIGSKTISGATDAGAWQGIATHQDGDAFTASDGVVLAAGHDGTNVRKIAVDTSGQAVYGGGTDITASATGAASALTATLAGVASKTTCIAGFIVTGAGATGASVITITVTGTISGTLSFALVIPAGATTSITPLIVEFSRPIPASAANTAIVVNVPSFGAGNTNAAVVAHGFQL